MAIRPDFQQFTLLLLRDFSTLFMLYGVQMVVVDGCALGVYISDMPRLNFTPLHEKQLLVFFVI